MENNVSLLPSELAKMRIQKDEVGPTEEAEEEPKRAEFSRRVKKLSHFVRKLNHILRFFWLIYCRPFLEYDGSGEPC